MGQRSGSRESFSNIISIPRGGQYKLQLPDGSKVWLNAASSLRFPTAFDDKERRVELKGEAYFEITPLITKEGRKSRFIVDIDPFPGIVGTRVEVLGTHFNIMAYNDERDMKTTLLEGAVKVTKGTATQLLVPGQQARINKEGPIRLVENVDVNEAVAWKNGYFQFTSDNLSTVMRQIARWYDVDISYEGKIPERQFGGKISRNANISEILRILELSNVHFRIENKRIIVSP
jgi:ferric-dicitrate binding protein FerR (iron transport regulator)